ALSPASPPVDPVGEPASALARADARRLGGRELALALALALLAAALHARMLGVPWLDVSDPFGAARASTGAAPTNLGAAWCEDGLGGVLLLFENASGGAFVSRLVNLALHAGAAVLAFLCLRRFALPRGAAGLAAALFAVHPLHVEAAAWLAQRSSLF